MTSIFIILFGYLRRMRQLGLLNNCFKLYAFCEQGTLYAFSLLHILEIILNYERKSLKIDRKFKMAGLSFYAFKFCIIDLLWIGVASARLMAFWEAILLFILCYTLILIKVSIKNICRSVDFALALFMNAFPTLVTLFFVMLSVKYKGNMKEEAKRCN